MNSPLQLAAGCAAVSRASAQWVSKECAGEQNPRRGIIDANIALRSQRTDPRRAKLVVGAEIGSAADAHQLRHPVAGAVDALFIVPMAQPHIRAASS